MTIDDMAQSPVRDTGAPLTTLIHSYAVRDRHAFIGYDETGPDAERSDCIAKKLAELNRKP